MPVRDCKSQCASSLTVLYCTCHHPPRRSIRRIVVAEPSCNSSFFEISLHKLLVFQHRRTAPSPRPSPSQPCTCLECLCSNLVNLAVAAGTCPHPRQRLCQPLWSPFLQSHQLTASHPAVGQTRPVGQVQRSRPPTLPWFL
jgi:hypothetical protein